MVEKEISDLFGIMKERYKESVAVDIVDGDEEKLAYVYEHGRVPIEEIVKICGVPANSEIMEKMIKSYKAIVDSEDTENRARVCKVGVSSGQVHCSIEMLSISREDAYSELKKDVKRRLE